LFTGKIEDSSGSKRTALFSEAGSLLLKVGDAAPHIEGAVIAGLSDPAGDAVLVTLQRDVGSVDGKNDTVLYADFSNGDPKIVAREGDLLQPDLRLRKFEAFDAAGSTVFFLVRLMGTDARGPSHRALCAAAPGEGARVLVKAGDTFGNETVDLIETLISARGSPAEGRWRAGADAFGVKLTRDDDSQAIYTIPASAVSPVDWRLWITSNTAWGRYAPPQPRAATLGLPGFTAGGVALTRKVTAPTAFLPPETLAATDHIQVLSLRDGDRQPVPANPAQVPDASGAPISGVVFRKFAAPVDGPYPRTAFTAFLAGDGVSDENEMGIWHTGTDGILKLLARTGDPALGGGVWTKFESLVLPDGPESGPIFTARVGEARRTERGLWAVGSSGVLHLLLRTNLPIAIGETERIVRSFVALQAAPGSGGVARGYDDDRHVTALVAFRDGTQILLSMAIP
jgi:hypothetical protein